MRHNLVRKEKKMTDKTRDMLFESMENVRDRLTELMECLDNGRPFTYDELPDGFEWAGDTLLDADGNEVDPDEVPEVDWLDAHDKLSEYPLAVVDERGRNFAVVLATGGPHIEIEAEGWRSASLHGYWGGEHVVLSGEVFDRVLDWFIER